MKAFLRQLLVAITFLVIVISPAQAQESEATNSARDRQRKFAGKETVEKDLQRARFRRGSFYLLSELAVDDAGYDADIYSSSPDESGDLQQSASGDLSVTISAPQKLYYVPTKKFAVSAEARPGYIWFAQQSRDRSFNSRYRGDVHFMFNRLYLNFHGLIADERKRDLSELNFLVNTKNRQFGSDAEMIVTGRTSLRGSVRSYQFDYPANDRIDDRQIQLLARNELITSAVVRHKTFPATALELGVERNRFDFDLDTARNGAQESVFVGAIREDGARSLRARLALTQLNYNDVSKEDYTGPTGSLSYRLSPRRKVQVQTEAERRLEFSIFQSNSHFAADRLRVMNDVDVTRKLTLRALGEVGQNGYFVAVNDIRDGRIKKRRDQILYGSLGFLYTVRKIRAGFDVGYFDRTSNFERYNDDGIRLILRLSIIP